MATWFCAPHTATLVDLVALATLAAWMALTGFAELHKNRLLVLPGACF